jgi:hypothetical protein
MNTVAGLPSLTPEYSRATSILPVIDIKADLVKPWLIRMADRPSHLESIRYEFLHISNDFLKKYLAESFYRVPGSATFLAPLRR